jgi:hypothetical protein
MSVNGFEELSPSLHTVNILTRELKIEDFSKLTDSTRR